MFGRWWFGYACKHLGFNKGNKCQCSLGWKHYQHIIRELGFFYKMAVCLCFYSQTINIKWLFIHISGNKQIVYENSLTMLGSLIMCTAYTNKFTVGQLKLRLGLECHTHIYVNYLSSCNKRFLKWSKKAQNSLHVV